MDTSSGQVPLSIHVDPEWILSRDDCFKANKVSMVDSELQNAETSDTKVALDKSTPTEEVWAGVVVYIHL